MIARDGDSFETHININIRTPRLLSRTYVGLCLHNKVFSYRTVEDRQKGAISRALMRQLISEALNRSYFLLFFVTFAGFARTFWYAQCADEDKYGVLVE